jgi:redox-sensitive bicupin YhaK (pirin superfamily)
VAVAAGRARVLAGSAFGVASPVGTASPTLAVAFDLDVGTEAGIRLDADAASERALYAVDHPFEIDGVKVDEFTLAGLGPGRAPGLTAPRGGRVFLIGGEPLGHRFMSWNFVSSRRERILEAEADWRAQRFPRIPGETEFIPLPDRRP